MPLFIPKTELIEAHQPVRCAASVARVGAGHRDVDTADQGGVWVNRQGSL